MITKGNWPPQSKTLFNNNNNCIKNVNDAGGEDHHSRSIEDPSLAENCTIVNNNF